MKNTSTNNNNPSHSLYIKLALLLGAITFSIIHPLTVSLLSVSYFFISNLTVEEAAVLKQKAKENVNRAVSTVIEKQVQPRLSQYVEESKSNTLLPSSVEEDSVKALPFVSEESLVEIPTIDLPSQYAKLFTEDTKFPKTKSCFTKQYNSELADVISTWTIEKKQQFVIDFAELISKKTKERILSTSLRSLPISTTPLTTFSEEKIQTAFLED